MKENNELKNYDEEKEEKEKKVKNQLKEYSNEPNDLFSMMQRYMAISEGLMLWDLLNFEDSFFSLDATAAYKAMEDKIENFLTIQNRPGLIYKDKEKTNQDFSYTFLNDNGKIEITIEQVNEDEKDKITKLLDEKETKANLNDGILKLQFEDKDGKFNNTEFEEKVRGVLFNEKEKVLDVLKKKKEAGLLSDKAQEFVNIAKRYVVLNNRNIENTLALSLNGWGDIVSVYGERVSDKDLSDYLEKRYDIFLRTFKRPGIIQKR